MKKDVKRCMAGSVRKQLCRYYSPVEQGILVHLDLAQSSSTIQTYCQIGNLQEIKLDPSDTC